MNCGKTANPTRLAIWEVQNKQYLQGSESVSASSVFSFTKLPEPVETWCGNIICYSSYRTFLTKLSLQRALQFRMSCLQGGMVEVRKPALDFPTWGRFHRNASMVLCVQLHPLARRQSCMTVPSYKSRHLREIEPPHCSRPECHWEAAKAVDSAVAFHLYWIMCLWSFISFIVTL